MYYKDLVKELNGKKLRNIYLLYGDDEGFIFETVRKIRELTKVAEDDIFNFIRLDGQKLETSDLENAISTLPFMGERKYVEVFRADFLTGAKNIKDSGEKLEVIQKYLVEPAEDTVLVMYYTYENDLEKNDTKIKAMEKKSNPSKTLIFKMPSVQKDSVSELAEQYFEENGINPGKNIIAYIRDTYEGSVTSLKNDINKIVSYSQGRAITKDDVDKLLVKSSNMHIFNLMDFMMSSRAREAVELYNDLVFKGMDPSEVLVAIGSRLREVYNYKVMSHLGYSLEQIMKELNVRSSWQAQNKLNLYTRTSITSISMMFKALIETEERFKSFVTDPENEIELLILQIASVANN